MAIDTNRAIEILQCAEINCDNVKKIGPMFADFVKLQIQEAIGVLGGDVATEKVTT